jgi:tetratricopeptide (TPR) repeat protein
VVLPALILPLQIGTATVATECRDGQLSVVATVRELLDRGDDEIAGKAVASLSADSTRCPPLELMRLAVGAWFDVRALAAVGGASDRLGPVRAVLDQLSGLKPEPTASLQQKEAFSLQVQYAATALQAAIAAAQDERPEMELLLGHARDLVQRLEQRAARATWPRPFNLLAGELWFEVDRYEEARVAYERAVQADATSAALVGLARTQARLGRYELACATYKRTRDVGATLREAAKYDLARCR